jgi:hypothetical protein
MRKLALFVSAALVVATAGLGVARAQDAADDQETAKPVERRHIQVLDDPHDIASFYRSSQEPVFYGPLGAPYPMDSSGLAASRYPIASFYRNEGSRSLYGYSRFWTNGYGGGGAARPIHGAAMGRYGRYGRRIGQNGDIFLMAPTFLAPVGPLTGVFLDR